MTFLEEVVLRVLTLGLIIAGVVGAVSGGSENVRALACLVIIIATGMYMFIVLRWSKS